MSEPNNKSAQKSYGLVNSKRYGEIVSELAGSEEAGTEGESS